MTYPDRRRVRPSLAVFPYLGASASPVHKELVHLSPPQHREIPYTWNRSNYSHIWATNDRNLYYGQPPWVILLPLGEESRRFTFGLPEYNFERSLLPESWRDPVLACTTRCIWHSIPAIAFRELSRLRSNRRIADTSAPANHHWPPGGKGGVKVFAVVAKGAAHSQRFVELIADPKRIIRLQPRFYSNLLLLSNLLEARFS